MKEAILSLISGLVGAVIGSLTTFLSTRYSIEKSSKKAIDLDNTRKKKSDKEKINNALLSLYTEVIENLASIEEWKKFHSKFRFSQNAWEKYKSLFINFGEDVQKKVIKVYVEISRHNTLIDYDLRVSVGSGVYDSRIEDQVKKIEETLIELKVPLRSVLRIKK